jgi:hypothetical protein
MRGEATAQPSLLQAVLLHTPRLTSLQCSSRLFSSDALFMLQRGGQQTLLPQLKHLELLDH